MMLHLNINNSMRKLSFHARKFVQLQVLYTGMNAILTLFINTFLLNAYGSFSKQVLLYNMIMADNCNISSYLRHDVDF